MKIFIVTFESTHKAIKFEKDVKDIFDYEIIPTPREVSASCGISVKFNIDDLDGIWDLIVNRGITDVELYVIYKNEKGEKLVEKIDGGKLCH